MLFWDVWLQISEMNIIKALMERGSARRIGVAGPLYDGRLDRFSDFTGM